MKQLIYILSTFLFPLVTHAIVGTPEYVANVGPDAACFITLTDETDGSTKGQCSGTLVAANKILSAAHCLDDSNLKINVSCGFVEAKSTNIFTSLIEYKGGITEAVFKESAEAKVLHVDRANDLLVLELAKSFSLKPFPILKNAYEEVKEVGHLRGCFVAAYGLYNDESSGVLRTGRMAPVYFEKINMPNMGPRAVDLIYLENYFINKKEYEKFT